MKKPAFSLLRNDLRATEKGGDMYKLITIGALIAALAAPVSAAGTGLRVRTPGAQIACPQNVVIPPGRNYGTCGHKFWIRDSQTGQVKAIRFWRLQRLSDPNEDRP